MKRAVFAIAIALFLCFTTTYAQDAKTPQAVMDAWKAMTAQPCVAEDSEGASGRSEGAGVPEGYSDGVCTTPALLTGTVFLGGDSSVYPGYSVVWDGAAYGVAWADEPVAGNTEIYFARVAADGTPLIPATRITNSTGASNTPSMVWTGTEFGVAWEDNRDADSEIYFARISVTGAKVGSDVRVTNAADFSLDPSLVWTGTQYGVAWEDERDGGFSEVYFARLDASGAKIGTDVRVTNDPSFSDSTSLAWSGYEFAVAWCDWRTGSPEIFLVRLSAAGTKIGSDLQITTGGGGSPSLTWAQSQYGLVWDALTGGTTFARLDPEGTKIGSDIAVSSVAAVAGWPFIAWTGSEFGVVWYDDRNGNDEIYFARVTAAGAKTGSDFRVTTGGVDCLYPTLAFGSLGYSVVFSAGTLDQAGFVALGCRSDTTPPTCPTGLAVTGNSGYGVTLTWTHGGVDTETEIAYHRVYRDGTAIGVTTESTYTDTPRPSGSPTYTVVTVNANGRESTGCAVVTATAPEGGCGNAWTEPTVVSTSTGIAEAPQAAWDGSAYGVVWDDNRDGNYEIYFARVAPDGAVLVPATRVTNQVSSSYRPSIAWTGTEYGVAWYDFRTTSTDIYFTRIAKDGTKLLADTQITNDAALSYIPSLVWTGSEYGVSWYDTRTTTSDIYFARISAAGAKVGSDVQITSDASSSALPSLVWTSEEYGVVWHDSRTTTYDIYFARISAAGAKVGSDVQITSDAGSSQSPSLVWNGEEYGVAWYDNRSTSNDIYFARITALGVKQGGDIQVTNSSTASYAPALAWTGSEYAVAWYENREGSNDIYYASLDTSGYKIGTDRRMTSNNGSESSLALAVGGRGLGIFWRLDVAGDQLRFLGLGCGDLDTTPPSCPASPAETARTSTTVTLAWGPSVDSESDLGHYVIYKDGSVVGATSNLSWTDSSFDPAAGYVYIIGATNAAGYESGGCTAVDTSDTVPPPCPANLLISWNSATSLTFSWLPVLDAKSGLKQYKVYKNDVFLANVAAGTTFYTDATVSAGTPYSFAVLAEDYAGNLSVGCTSISTLDTTPPPCPGNLLIAWNSTTSLTLSWLASQDTGSGLKQYKVYKNDVFLANVAAGTTFYTDATVSAGTTYSFAALAEDWAGNLSTGCMPISTLDTTPPPCPGNLLIAWNSTTSLTLSWLASQDTGSGLKQYKVYKNDVFLANVAAGTMTYTDNSVSAGTTYTYSVRAEDYAGNLSQDCPSLSTQDGLSPTCPGGLVTTSVSATSIALAWFPAADAGSGLRQYKVYRNGALLSDVPAGTTTYTDSAVASGTTYAYGVLAEDWAGNLSAGCASLQVTAADTEGPCGDPWTATIPVTTISGVNNEPSIAWDGAAYGVAWMDTRDGNYEIYFTRVSPDGTVLVPATRITNDAAGSFQPSLVWTGDEYGVAWYDQRTPTYDIYFARIGLDGAKIGSDVQITSDPADSTYPSLVWTGVEYGVAWKDTRTTASDIYFARISAAGAKVGSDVQITSDAGQSDLPSLVWADTQYGVAWYDTRSTMNDIYFALISAAGVKTTLDVQITSDPDQSYAPSLAWTGSEFGMAWYDTRGGLGTGIYFARISSGGAKVGSDVPVSAYPMGGSTPSLVWKDTGYSLAWKSSRTGTLNIFFASLDASGTKIGADRNLSNSGAQDKEPALARGGDGLGLVYRKDIAADELYFVGLGCGTPDTTPPSCPASPAETARTATTVTLGWGPSVDPDSDLGAYKIYRDGSLLGATTNTTWTDSAFNPAAGYVYIVTVANAAGIESGSCASVDTSDHIQPSCVGGIQASVAAGTVTLNWVQAWDDKSGVKEYRVYRNGTLRSTIAVGTNTFSEAVAPGTTYNYVVETADWAGNTNSGCTSCSVWVYGGTLTLYLTKNADTVNANLDWNDVGITEYVVYRSLTPQVGYEHERVPLSETRDMVLKDGVRLWFYYIQQRE